MEDIKIHVHAPDGSRTTVDADPTYETAKFLKELVRILGLSVTADWSVHDADINCNLDKNKTLEGNGVREGHHLHLRERELADTPGPSRASEPSRPTEPPHPAGQKRARIGGSDPVVGWLVCIHGPETGKDYKIRSGNNSIGRSPDMDISISGDETISRDRHAVISFDPQTNSFHFRPGEGRGLAYVNEKAVFGAAQLQPYDEIVVGKTKVLFVPFCGDSFIWLKDVS